MGLYPDTLSPTTLERPLTVERQASGAGVKSRSRPRVAARTATALGRLIGAQRQTPRGAVKGFFCARIGELMIG